MIARDPTEEVKCFARVMCSSVAWCEGSGFFQGLFSARQVDWVGFDDDDVVFPVKRYWSQLKALQRWHGRSAAATCRFEGKERRFGGPLMEEE